MSQKEKNKTKKGKDLRLEDGTAELVEQGQVGKVGRRDGADGRHQQLGAVAFAVAAGRTDVAHGRHLQAARPQLRMAAPTASNETRKSGRRTAGRTD